MLKQFGFGIYRDGGYHGVGVDADPMYSSYARVRKFFIHVNGKNYFFYTKSHRVMQTYSTQARWFSGVKRAEKRHTDGCGLVGYGVDVSEAVATEVVLSLFLGDSSDASVYSRCNAVMNSNSGDSYDKILDIFSHLSNPQNKENHAKVSSKMVEGELYFFHHIDNFDYFVEDSKTICNGTVFDSIFKKNSTSVAIPSVSLDDLMLKHYGLESIW